MKEAVLLLSVVCVSLPAISQNLHFVYENGTQITTGTTITVNTTQEDAFGDLILPLTGIYVENGNASEVGVYLNATVRQLPSGSFSCCLGSQCKNTSAVSTINITNIAVKSGNKVEINQTEWYPTVGSYGTCVVDFQIGTTADVTGDKITVNFVYADPTPTPDPDPDPGTSAVFRNLQYSDASLVRAMSDDGLFAVASLNGSSSSNETGLSKTRLINLENGDTLDISDKDNTAIGADIANTDEALTVVGSKAGYPAVFTEEDGWMSLPTQSPYVYGSATSITADGKYAVGSLYYSDGMKSIPAMWKLTSRGGRLQTLSGFPEKDMGHNDMGQMTFRSISADGKYALGCMSYSYLPTGLDLGGCFFFIYDIENQTYKPIGFTETESGRWTPKADGLIVIMEAYMSNNGRYVTGTAHLARDVEGEDYADEYTVPFLYDVEKDFFQVYDETAVKDTYGCAVTNDGVVISASPATSPVREWSIRYGSYWFSFSEILRQKYGIDYSTATSFDNTGTVSAMTDDAKRLIAFPDPYKSYMVDFPVPVTQVSKDLKLLGSYSVSPTEGASVSHLKNITVTFDRAITTVGGVSSAHILDSNDKIKYNSVAFAADGKTLKIRFRTGTLAEGESYRLHIPAGTIAVADDATQTNSDIYVTYNGRADVAMAPNTIYPADDATFSHIDYSTSPVLLTFDDDILITDTATAHIYRNEETEPYCSLTLARSANKLALYPSTTQYLYDGSTYRVVVDEGAVTDLAGNNPNETITIHYNGNYVRKISPDDVILFSDDFDSGLGNFMQWCGDQGTPTSAMQDWDFSKGIAWGLVRESNSSADEKAASHSNYSPSAQSDDWLVIPQLYIPDMLCSMNFLSQSYDSSKNDVLKVVVWESNDVYNTLSSDVMTKMKAEGKVVYSERQSAGATQEGLTGEFTKVDISLADFAGKNVYIAFVNQNEDQSAIFLDSIEVRHDMRYLTNLIYDESVVNKSSINIKGTLIGNNEAKAYDTAKIELKDADGNVIDTYNAQGMNLAKGSQYSFQFSQPLPLTVGIENKFVIAVTVDSEENSITGTVKDLAFEPVKRIVLEEYTGRACGNCPLGILGIEKLEARYGDHFIPVSIHTYNNDPLSNGLSSYTSNLGISSLGAPSGIINRGTGCYPAVSATVDGTYRYFFTYEDPDLPDATDKLWMDYANDEMTTPADCSIDITNLTYDTSSMTFQATCDIRYALNANNLNVNLFTCLLEDNLSQAQSNYMASISSPDLGEWGLGGKYGQTTVTDYIHKDVCRNISATTINGTGGYIPASVEAGKSYIATVSIANPYTSAVLTQCKVVIMMIDADTGKVINAACSPHYGTTGISQIDNGELTIDNSPCYNLAGQRIGQIENGKLKIENYRGIVIVNGKKIYKK